MVQVMFLEIALWQLDGKLTRSTVTGKRPGRRGQSRRSDGYDGAVAEMEATVGAPV